MKRLLVVLMFLLVGCGVMVNEDEAVRTLEEAGYTDVNVITAHNLAPQYYKCSEEDDVAFECRAKNQAGDIVTVTVCANFWFKGSTIRH
jgi:hypothetical protein